VRVSAPTGTLETFAADVGVRGPITVVGGRTQWQVGGPVRSGTREIAAPSGVVTFEPAEMTVRVRAGTTVEALDDALAERGQCVALPAQPGATVGGVLSVGRTDVRRLGRGPLRDTLLEARYVSAEGRLVKAGGPTVKNVSGFDLCRLLVGSLGTLGLLAEVVLRTRPRPEASQWMAGDVDPFDLYPRLVRPGAILWDGTTTWVLLEGRTGDVEAGRGQLASLGLRPAGGPPDLPLGRWSLDPAMLPSLAERTDSFVAEVGVGVVHGRRLASPPSPSPAVISLTRRLRTLFDPEQRLNPGRDVLGVGS
jgi:FAD/FMN-containing dehydrogenase